MKSLLVVLAVTLCFSYSSAATSGHCKADLVFCLDNSGSIATLDDGSPDSARPPTNWLKMLKFCKDLVSQMTISSSDSLVGAVDFGDKARIDFDLDDYQTSTGLKAALDGIKFIGSTTNTTGGLFKSRKILQDASAGARSGVPKIIVLVTDGNPNEAEKTNVVAEAQNCRDAGVRVIVVGITDYVNDDVLSQLASTPKDYLSAPTFSELENVHHYILQGFDCKTIEPEYRTTTLVPPPTTTPEEEIPDC